MGTEWLGFWGAVLGALLGAAGALGGGWIGARSILRSEKTRWEHERNTRYNRDRANAYARMATAANDLLRYGLAPNNSETWNRLMSGRHEVRVLGTDQMNRQAGTLLETCKDISADWQRWENETGPEKPRETEKRCCLENKLAPAVDAFVMEARKDLDLVAGDAV